jgi:hypothetical protein
LTHIGTVQLVITSAEAAIKDEIDSVKKLAAVASDFPYYKFVFHFDHRDKLTVLQIQWHVDKGRSGCYICDLDVQLAWGIEHEG